MNLELNPKQLVDSLSHLLHRYHIVIFVLVVVGGLATATFFLNSAMSPSTDTSAAAPTSKTPVLDTATIDKIEALNDHSTRLVVPTDKRTNPFN